jgi:hypothetical protein
MIVKNHKGLSNPRLCVVGLISLVVDRQMVICHAWACLLAGTR